VTGYDGGAFRIDGRRIVAANPALHAGMLEVISARPEAHGRP